MPFSINDLFSNPKSRVILALDGITSAREGIQLLKGLESEIGMIMLGGGTLVMLTTPSLLPAMEDPEREKADRADVHELLDIARQTGLMFDEMVSGIPSQASLQIRMRAMAGPRIMTVDASNPAETLRACAKHKGQSLLVAVTAPTSLGRTESIRQRRMDPEALTESLTEHAIFNGVDGVICSPKYTGQIRRMCGSGRLIITPSIRLPDDPELPDDDQVERFTAREAIRWGADAIIVGRKALQRKEDLRGVIRRFVEDVALGLDDRKKSA